MSPRTIDVGRSAVPVSPLSSAFLLLVPMDGSDSCTVHTTELSASDRMRMMIWHRGKAAVSHLLNNVPPKIPRTCFCLPYDIVEMITTRLTSNLAALKVFLFYFKSLLS